MAKMAYTPSAAAKAAAAPPAAPELSEEEKSKDAFFVQLAHITEAMIAKHGKDFAMGTLVLSARFIAENKPLVKGKAGAAAN
jgi:hypothetical protein